MRLTQGRQTWSHGGYKSHHGAAVCCDPGPGLESTDAGQGEGTGLLPRKQPIAVGGEDQYSRWET